MLDRPSSGAVAVIPGGRLAMVPWQRRTRQIHFFSCRRRPLVALTTHCS